MFNANICVCISNSLFKGFKGLKLLKIKNLEELLCFLER